MNKNVKKYIKINYNSTNAVTLITLIITIIILIILAGIVINISIRENGIFNKTKQAKNAYNQSVAKEKLELVLEEARIDKETKNEYNSEEYLDNLLESKGITANENEAIVDNYNFKIDREKLTITEILGETEIKIKAEVQEYLGKNADDKYEASILLKIESNSSLQKVTMQNPDGTIFEMQTDKKELEKDITVEFDKEYIVTAVTKDGRTQTRKIIERTEEIIKTAEELAEFRDKVNTPLTYEGKIVKLGRDIDLSSIYGENANGEEISWEPIGSNNAFKGTFDGNNYTISNIYIKSNEYYQGLFAIINGAIIKNIIIDNSIITGSHYIGVIGYSENKCILENIHTTKNVIIEATTPDQYACYVGGIIGCAKETTIQKVSNCATVIGNNGGHVGGIAGVSYSSISESYNLGNIKAYGNNSNVACIGGIIGLNSGSIKLSDCYNIGSVEGYNGIGGIVGFANGLNSMVTITNCYNIGTIKGTQNVGEIVGGNNSNSYRKINNSYTKTQSITATVLGNAYTSDIKKEDDTWKYNNGYPILKWQIK